MLAAAQNKPHKLGVPSSSPTFTEVMAKVLQLVLKIAEGNSLINRVDSFIECPVKFYLLPLFKEDKHHHLD